MTRLAVLKNPEGLVVQVDNFVLKHYGKPSENNNGYYNLILIPYNTWLESFLTTMHDSRKKKRRWRGFDK